MVKDRVFTVWVAPNAATGMPCTVTAWEVTCRTRVTRSCLVKASLAACVTEGRASHSVRELWRTVNAGILVLVLA